MRKRLKDANFEYFRDNASKGSDFNKQLMSVQIENVYTQNDLKVEIVRLRKSVEAANKQGVLSEKSNQRLQMAIFGLTIVTTATALFGVTNSIFAALGSSGWNLVFLSTLATSLITVGVSILLSNEIKKW